MAVINMRAAGSPAVEREVTNWTQVVSHLDPKYGGIAASVPEFARATEDAGFHSCGLLGFCRPEETRHLRDGQATAISLAFPSRSRNLLDARARTKLRHCIEAADGLHIHGLWEAHSMITSNFAQAYRRPYMLSAHGMLDSWALKQGQVKKTVYAALIELPVMQKAACLRALTNAEVDDYRRIGLTNPVVVIPNGVSVPESVDPSLFWSRFPHLRGKQIALFLGRLHEKKGLSLLLEAWHRLCQEKQKAADEIHLVIAGPDFGGFQARLQQRAGYLGVTDSVTFAGMLGGDEKWSALAAASVFVLPSFSEGFSVAVLEALAMSVPVIVSEPCHFPEVSQANCGWVIQPNVSHLFGALQKFFQLPEPEVTNIGQRGRRLVDERFSWSVVGKQMSEVYSWLDGAPKPHSVEVIH